MNFQNPMKLSCGPLIFFKDFVGVLIHNTKIPLMYFTGVVIRQML